MISAQKIFDNAPKNDDVTNDKLRLRTTHSTSLEMYFVFYFYLLLFLFWHNCYHMQYKDIRCC